MERKPKITDEDLRRAARRGMTDEQRERQRQNWADAEEELEDSSTEENPTVH